MRVLDFDIYRMIELRKQGWNYSALGREFHKDHTTIMYHCRRYGVSTPDQTEIKIAAWGTVEHVPWIPKPRVRREEKYADILYEKTNEGKSYKQYLKESLKRPVEKRYFKIYYETPLTPDDSRNRRTSRASKDEE